MRSLSVRLVAVLVIGFLLLGCTQRGLSPSVQPSATSIPSFATSATPSASGSVHSASQSPDAFNMSGLDPGPDMSHLDNLTQEMSAGDVSPPPDNSS